MKINIFHANECDKKRCTAVKLEKTKRAKMFYHLNQIPRGAIVLNPFSVKAVSIEDKKMVLSKGIVGLDCSWNKVSSSSTFFNLTKYHRALPFLIAASPVNYGKSSTLSTAEAISATLYITGFKNEAKDIMSVFKWGHTFIELNYELLEEYSGASSSAEVVSIQNDFLKNK
ncbi:MAG: DUF367 family protein [Methanobrevibacter sp.]|jgi:pre-rRNA-processing protein TSR3|nr:DUF367 family protein [Candidatus Methanoflexus mossambicus]